MATERVHVGCGAGFSGDRTDASGPVVDALAASGRPSYLIFETLAESTLALAQLARRADEKEFPAQHHQQGRGDEEGKQEELLLARIHRDRRLEGEVLQLGPRPQPTGAVDRRTIGRGGLRWARVGWHASGGGGRLGRLRRKRSTFNAQR